jgi:hypothetical protein
LAGDASLLSLRTAALAFWIACVVFLIVPTHGKSAGRFHGTHLPQPKPSPARGL